MKTLLEYLRLPYTRTVRWDDRDSMYVARVKEIPGCAAHGDTELAALEMLRDNMEDWFADCLEKGDAIPLPEDAVSLPSGKWVQRVPRSLHKRLTELAEQEQVSLNQLVVSYLSEAIGRRDRVSTASASSRLPSEVVVPGIVPDLKAGYAAPDNLYGAAKEGVRVFISHAHDDWSGDPMIGTWRHILPIKSHGTIHVVRGERNFGYQEEEFVSH